MENKILNLINSNVSVEKKDVKLNESRKNDLKDNKFYKVLNKNTQRQKSNRNNFKNNEKVVNDKPDQLQDVKNNETLNKSDNISKDYKEKLQQLKSMDNSRDKKTLEEMLQMLMFACALDFNIDLKEILENVNNSIGDMVYSVLNDIKDQEGIKINDLLKNLSEDINNLIDYSMNKLPISEEKTGELLNEVVKSVKDEIGNIINNNLNNTAKSTQENTELLNNIKEQISNLFFKEGKNSSKSNTIESFHKNIKSILEDINKNNLDSVNKSQSSDQQESSLFSKEDNNLKEEELLKSVSKDGKDNKFLGRLNFMNQFTNMNKIGSEAIQEVESMIGNKQTLVLDVVKAVKFMDLNNLKNLTVKINPKQLGELVINVVMENGKMKANITANNKEAFSILNANMHDITNKLQDSNIKIENFTLNLYEDTTFFKEKEGSRSREESGRNNPKNERITAVEKGESEKNINPLEELNNISRLA